MAAKKQTIILEPTLLPAVDEYISLLAEKKAIEERLEQLKEQYKSILINVFDPTKNFRCGRLGIGARQTLELDQMACLKAFENKKKRDFLFPRAVLFKAGESKDIVVEEGLGIYQYGGAVFTVKD